MAAADLPKGFYDSPKDFEGWIAGDVSPQEIQERVQLATEATASADSFYKQALQDLHGVGQGGMVALFLDQKRALPLIQKQAQAARIGAESLRQGLGFNASRAQQFANMGVSQEEARRGYGQIAEFLPDAAKLGRIYQEDYDITTAEDEVLGGSGAAARKRQRLTESEKASFSGSAGTGRSSLSKRTTGSY